MRVATDSPPYGGESLLLSRCAANGYTTLNSVRDLSFYYNFLRPGRYLGSEPGLPAMPRRSGSSTVVWFYPGLYEQSMTDVGWRRSYFQAAEVSGLQLARAVDYAPDVWRILRASNEPVFALDLLADLRCADGVVFWAPDVLAAARIPSLVRRAGLGSLPVGVFIEGNGTPRFLRNHVTWVKPLPGGWHSSRTSSELQELTNQRVASPSIRADEPGLNPTAPDRTRRWYSHVDIGKDWVDVDLGFVNESGILTLRTVDDIVMDGLDGLRTTGIDGLRFCDCDIPCSATMAAVLAELQRHVNTKRLRVTWPSATTAEFGRDWLDFKPHFLKPGFTFKISPATDVGAAIEMGRRAFTSGWHGLAAELHFESFKELAELLSRADAILTGWETAARIHADRRHLGVRINPAPIDRWKDSPSQPHEDDLRGYLDGFRRFKDGLPRGCSMDEFQLEDVIARNWLAATELDIWDKLADVDYEGMDENLSQRFDWFGWIRQKSGMSAAPQSSFLIVGSPLHSIKPDEEKSRHSIQSSATLPAPAGQLFGRRKRRAAPSSLSAPLISRLRVRWGKDVSWRLFSHLDSVRAIERAVRRSTLPAAYSEGFHPRMKLSFGPPLSFGLISDCEYFDLILDQQVTESDTRKLAEAFPDGLRLIEALGVPAGMPALTDTINESTFEAILPLDLDQSQQHLDRFNAEADLRWNRPGREDRQAIDPRKTLRDTSVQPHPDGALWRLAISIGGEANLRPMDWARNLFQLSAEQVSKLIIRRTGLFICKGTSVRTPFDLS